MAKAAAKGRKSGRKKEKRVVPHGTAHIGATFNNTVITISDPTGNVVTWSSAGQVGFKMAATVDYETYPKDGIYPGLMWEQVFIGGSPVFEADTYLNFDARISFFHKAYSTRSHKACLTSILLTNLWTGFRRASQL